MKPKLAEVDKCIARFSKLERFETGIPDMLLPEFHRTFLNVLGFSQPKGTGQFSPFGDTAPAAVTHLKAGFGVSFVAVRPGKGVAMHIHDSTDYRILEPLDFTACPIGAEHCFQCIEAPPGQDEALIQGIVVGESPAAIGSPASIRHMVEVGVFTPERAEAVLKNTETPHW
jgi:hypothetical protein